MGEGDLSYGFGSEVGEAGGSKLPAAPDFGLLLDGQAGGGIEDQFVAVVGEPVGAHAELEEGWRGVAGPDIGGWAVGEAVETHGGERAGRADMHVVGDGQVKSSS